MALNVVALIVGIVLLTFGGKVYPLVFNALIFVAAITVESCFNVRFVLQTKWTLKIIDFATHAVHKITFGRVNLTTFTGQAVEATRHFHEAMQEFPHAPKAIAGSVFFLVVSWLFSLSIPFLVFQSLGHPVSWSIIIVT